MTDNERLTYKGTPQMTEDGMITPVYCDYPVRKIINRLAEFEAIGTVEEFKALKEKNEPKKAQEISWGATNCPICGQEFGFNSHFNHCSNCGQKLDWQ